MIKGIPTMVTCCFKTETFFQNDASKMSPIKIAPGPKGPAIRQDKSIYLITSLSRQPISKYFPNIYYRAQTFSLMEY